MLLFGSKLIDTPVLSLQTGGPIGKTRQPIIDPTKLKIEAYYLYGPMLNKAEANTLRMDEVRELSQIGMIIDSIDDLIDVNDVVRLKKVADLNFKLIGHKVVTKKGKKLGTVTDYTVDAGSFIVQQIIVHKPLMHSFNDPELTIHRSQIIEIDDYKIVVKDETTKVHAAAAVTADMPNFANPFRKEQPVVAEPASTKAAKQS
ncbi:PRC-barrel domain-containing protein [Candidatus Saccharibacteria bacterium]|nr:PRC-barrel domain-containing protein [Candidatus Saccharibacteria bacterium]